MKSYVASDLRDINRKNVFKLLQKYGETSRAELARRSGISTPTILKIVEFMLEKNLVEETGERGSAVGRKPQILRLNKNGISAVGVILEGEYIRASVVNLAGEISPSCLRRAGADLRESLTVILPDMIASLQDAAGTGKSGIYGIGLGIPCGYNPQTHVANTAPLIRVDAPTCILEFEQHLSRRFSMPVFVDNDVNLAVLGEYQARELDNADLIYLSLGTGFGAGVMLGGKLRHGRTWQCGEIGYMTFMDNCAAGDSNPGRLENSINLHALRKKFSFDPYDADPALLPDIIDYVAAPVAICVSDIVSLLDCDLIVLDGILPQTLGAGFLESVRRKVKELCAFDVSIDKPLCADPGVAGAASIVLDRAIHGILSGQE